MGPIVEDQIRYKQPLPWQQERVYTPLEPALIVGVHNPELCAGQRCTIHNRSKHAMRIFPQYFDNATRATWRICPHRNFHIDPDEMPDAITLYKHTSTTCPCGCCKLNEGV